jgi:hypothetical protein
MIKDARSLLLEKLAEALKDHDIFASAKTIIGEEKKTQDKEKQKTRITCKQYRDVNILLHCTHCGCVTETMVHLSPRDRVEIRDKDDKIYHITYKTLEAPVTVTEKVTFCPSCASFVASLERETLESMYLNLLKHHEMYMHTCRRYL